ncbi:hypothetical protein [Variovorax sp. UC74_104]|uniref:hypothetical protein n=1 Tax=Variovorax sp. UC74_104 TaxID=3374555 RepID=UPI003757771C
MSRSKARFTALTSGRISLATLASGSRVVRSCTSMLSACSAVATTPLRPRFTTKGVARITPRQVTSAIGATRNRKAMAVPLSVFFTVSGLPVCVIRATGPARVSTRSKRALGRVLSLSGSMAMRSMPSSESKSLA